MESRDMLAPYGYKVASFAASEARVLDQGSRKAIRPSHAFGVRHTLPPSVRRPGGLGLPIGP
jgi:hypothetical protein